MKRRDFLATCALVALPLRPVKPVRRMPTDCDLSVTSFLWASGQAGVLEYPNRYVLTVHTAEREYAERMLRALYAEPYQWSARVILMVRPFRYVDEWTLEGADAVVHSLGG